MKDLLAAHDGATDFYEQGALAAVPEVKRQLEGTVEGMRVGPYRVLSELGHGGMGAVYLAVRDPASFTHKVALKVIKRGMDTDEIVRRFVAERQILASLAHPNIARLFDGGSTSDGLPYFVMEYVQGRPITVYAAEAGEHGLDVEARLRLFLRVCRAVQHAHQSLVVHRDLKPANILVDAEGEPKLLDFGIAKLLDPSSFDGTTAHTGLAPGPMTPDYAAPEQLTGGTVTTATDVYGLGILLYELLVGENPRSAARKLGEGWSGRPPSQALVALAPERNAETRRRARRVSGDLDTIVGKALEPEPGRRYGTAAALAEDVERHLSQRPVAARRPTLAYRLGRGIVRHKLAAALALAAAVVVAIFSYHELAVSQERARFEAQRKRADDLNQFLKRIIQKADPEQSHGQTLTLLQILDAGAQELLGREAPLDAESRAALLETTGSTYADLGSYDKARRDLEQAVRLREGRRKPSPEAALAIAGTLTILGHVALHQNQYDASRSFYQRAIALQEGLRGSAALPLVSDWNGLGEIAFRTGKKEEAEHYFDKSLAVISGAEGGQRELAETLNGLGKLANLQGKLRRAQVLFGAVWRYYRSTLGEEHPDTLLARSNLANTLFRRKEYTEAEALYQEIADMRRRLLEPGHPDLANALLELAIAQWQSGHLAKARTTLGEVWQIRREHRLPADEDEAEAWDLQGNLYLDEDHLDAAEAAFKKGFETYEALPGEHRQNLADSLRRLALVRRRRGDLAGALELARRSLELTRAIESRGRRAV